MKKIVVLAGGKSAEREVSLKSGQAVLTALEALGYPCRMWDPLLDSVQELLDYQPDAAFIALHGPYGEDGCIQGFLETLGIPYAGSGVAASAIGMDKQLTKKILTYENLPTPAFLLASRSQPAEEIIRRTQALGFPVIVKAADQGSSIGTFFADSESQMREILQQVYEYDHKIVIEQYIQGMELTVAVLEKEGQLQALPIIEIDYDNNKLWDFEAKYTPGLFRHVIPARISEALQQKVADLAVQTFQALGCRGFARVDFMLDEAQNPYILEVNTLPGCTATSLFPDAARAAGISFEELVRQIVENI